MMVRSSSAPPFIDAPNLRTVVPNPTYDAPHPLVMLGDLRMSNTFEGVILGGYFMYLMFYVLVSVS